MGEASFQPDAGCSSAATRHASAELRQQIAAAEKTLASLTETAAGAGAAFYRNPADSALRKTADTAIKRLTEARNTLERLQLTLPAIEAEEAAEADRADRERRLKWRGNLERQRDHSAKELAKEPDYQAAETEKLRAAEAERDDLLAQRDALDARLDKLPLIISIQEERLADSQRRSERLAAEIAELEHRIEAFPLSQAEEEKQEAEAKAKADAEEARRIAEEEAAAQAVAEEEAARQRAEQEAKAEWQRRWDRIPGPDGKLDYRFNVERRAKEREEEEREQRSRPAGPQRSAEPWRSYQGPPFNFGRETAIRHWLRKALPADVEFALKCAATRKDQVAINLIEDHGALLARPGQ
jgi:hypothetical protein